MRHTGTLAGPSDNAQVGSTNVGGTGHSGGMTGIWAHRGCSLDAPENTLAAFHLAAVSGADGVEFDVQLSADGVPVVIHDELVDRTHSGSGWVKDFPLAELGALPSRAGGGDAQIPTLDQVLDVFAPTDQIINIELKNSVIDYPGLEPKVLAAVLDRGLAERTVLSSFNHYSLRRLQELRAPCELAAICGDLLYRPWDYLAGLGVGAVHPPLLALADPDYVPACHARGLAVRPWFSNDADELRRLFAAGIDALFTDVPELALSVRDEGGRTLRA